MPPDTKARRGPGENPGPHSKVIADQTTLTKVAEGDDHAVLLHWPTADYPGERLDFLAIVREPAQGLCGAWKIPRRPPFPAGASMCPECSLIRAGLAL